MFAMDNAATTENDHITSLVREMQKFTDHFDHEYLGRTPCRLPGMPQPSDRAETCSTCFLRFTDVRVDEKPQTRPEVAAAFF